jgi:hypothetical protein
MAVRKYKLDRFGSKTRNLRPFFVVGRFRALARSWLKIVRFSRQFCRNSHIGMGHAFLPEWLLMTEWGGEFMTNMMADKSVQNPSLEVGIFDSVEDARKAVHRLLDAGFSKEQLTVVCSDEAKERYFREFEHQDPAGTHTPTATIVGGTIGALLGGLTVIASAIATGSLALWAAGPITAWAGGVAGGLVGAMMTRGIEKELANFYQQAVVAGQILVAAEDHGPKHSQKLAQAAQILAESGAKPLPLREG